MDKDKHPDQYAMGNTYSGYKPAKVTLWNSAGFYYRAMGNIIFNCCGEPVICIGHKAF